MAPKSKTPEGELTAPELRKLIRAHNILSKIVIPKGTDRQGLIKLIEGKNYKVDHDKKVIRPKQQRGKQITLKKAEELTKPKPVSEEVKKKRAEKKKEQEEAKQKDIKIAKKEAVQEFKKKKKEAQKKQPKPEPKPKPKVMKKEDEVRPKEKVGRPKVDPKKIKVIEPKKKEEPKPRRKLKGRLTGVRDKETARIEKEIPEFYAPDKERDNKSNKIKQDIILSYRKIKSSGDKELIKQARELLEQSKSRVRVEKDITFNQDLLSILKKINDLGKEPKKEVKKEEPKKEEPKKEDRLTQLNNEVKKEVLPIFYDWLKNKDKKLYSEVKKFSKWKVPPVVDEETMKIIKKGVKNPRPKYYQEKEKMIKEAKKKFTELHKKYKYATPHREFTLIQDGILQGRGYEPLGIKRDEKMIKEYFNRRKNEREQIKKEKEGN